MALLPSTPIQPTGMDTEEARAGGPWSCLEEQKGVAGLVQTGGELGLSPRSG